MMIAVRVSAYTGVRTRVGREISKGDLIGVDPGTRDAVLSPVSGVVKGINFDPGSHTLIVDIEAAEIAAARRGNSCRRKEQERR
ncbi:glycine cleavage system protein H [Dehalococcoidia bacterium]|nr:glycine cleavage system protein H [Dehalococcoidia bacterium]